MLNPLSLQMGQTCSGKEINDWCNYQINNNGSHYKDAIRLLKKNFRDDREYYKRSSRANALHIRYKLYSEL